MTNETTNEQEVLLLRRKLDLLLRTGKMLMESAADTNRIERNMKRVTPSRHSRGEVTLISGGLC